MTVNLARRSFLVGLGGLAKRLVAGPTNLSHSIGAVNSNSIGLTVSSAGPKPDTPSPLTAADITYLGYFLLPPGSLSFSDAIIAGRYVGGNLQIFISKADAAQDIAPGVIEVTYPGQAMTNPPRASLITDWGDIYQGRRVSGAGTSPMRTGGLLYANGALWWSYYYTYNVAHSPDPSIGATELLNPRGPVVAAHGPWRCGPWSCHKTCGALMLTPLAATPFGISAPSNSSGNSESPWGTELNVAAFPALSSPPDGVRDRHVTIKLTSLIDHGISYPMVRDSNWLNCGWKVPYDYSKGGWTTPGTPTFQPVDLVTTGAWIQSSTKHGILFLGIQAQTIPGKVYASGDGKVHIWYGLDPCPHGQTGVPLYQGTGPNAGSWNSTYWLYDPISLSDPVARPTSDFWQNIGGVPPYYLFEYGGAFFDATSGKLFLSAAGADAKDNQPQIHVFQISM